jgi:hypothetical protein
MRVLFWSDNSNTQGAESLEQDELKMAKDVTIGSYPFVCVPLGEADFSDVAAVYVILCVAAGGSQTVLDVGQTGQLGSRIDEHERKDCWQKNCPSGNIWVCVYRMPSHIYSESDRLKVENELRQRFNPPCGKR